MELLRFSDAAGKLCFITIVTTSLSQLSIARLCFVMRIDCCIAGVALGIAFAFGWQLTLLTLAFVPFLALGGFLEFSLLTGQEEVEKEAYESAGSSRVVLLVKKRVVLFFLQKNTFFCFLIKKTCFIFFDFLYV